MAYSPDPEKERAPGFVRAVMLWTVAFGALFTLTPIIVRALFRLAGAA